MANLLFCNIGWMSRYQGLKGKPDKIVGGGKFVDENKRGAEVCNFLRAEDGYVYGHVETWHGRNTGAIDREIHLEKFGGGRGDSDKFDVIWTATDPENRGRKIVGWYKDAEVFRHRQYFDSFPSKQHRKDEVESYRVSVRAKNAH